MELVAEVESAHASAGSDDVRPMDISADGKSIVSSGADRTIKVWDLANPRPFIAEEWDVVEGKFPGAEKGNDPVIAYWKNTVTGDVRRHNRPLGELHYR